MSLHRRRIGTPERINDILYNTMIRNNENKKYNLIPYSDIRTFQYAYDHTDYVILSIINAYKNHFIDKKTCFNLIDKVDGYFYAFESGMINSVQFCKKLNKEIMEDELNKQDWKFLGVFNDMYQ